ncbi:MAG: deoxyribodipyrimidine photo-lyase [Pseudomonadota bacterium]
MHKNIAIHWFRQDLRLSDNPALFDACHHDVVMPIYIFDSNGENEIGAASKWWLYYSLQSLNRSLKGYLSIYIGDPMDILCKIIKAYPISSIYWNRCYEPWQIKRDSAIKTQLTANNINVKSHNGYLLNEPWNIKKKDNSKYQIFTPFYKKGYQVLDIPRKLFKAPQNIHWQVDKTYSVNIDQLKLLPVNRWDKKLIPHWDIGEEVAQKKLQTFIKSGLNHYKIGRDHPAQSYVSKLSPHLHIGEISPQQIWHALRDHLESTNGEHFFRELCWREFSYYQLYYYPDLPTHNLKKKFDRFFWVKDIEKQTRWQMGQTGIPMVDAGMRELWQTGYMHNRVRMIVGSFLVKNLRIHWHHGAKWFWDTLVDADLASNSASWQWIAGCGFDAAPYFRIFNPVIQGQKFDPEGAYIRTFIPELSRLSNKYIFNPWEAPQSILDNANIKLGKTYPKPIIDLKTSRDEALKAYQMLNILSDDE